MKPFYPAPSIRLAEVVRAGLPALFLREWQSRHPAVPQYGRPAT